jgi:hypothetical protein
LKRLGCRVEAYTPPVSTFGKFADDTRHVAGAFLVEVTGHWMTTSGGFYGDSNNMYEGPQPIESYHRAKRRVRRAWRVFAPALPMYTLEDRIAAAPRERKPKEDIRVVRARKLAAQVKAWESKKKRAETALKKLRPKLRRYEKLGIQP